MRDEQPRSNRETAAYHRLIRRIIASGKIVTGWAAMLLLLAVNSQPVGATPQVVSAPPSTFVSGNDAPTPTPGT